MLVAIDATPLTLSSGGLQRYTLELSTALAETYPEDTITLLSDQPFPPPEHAPPNLVSAPPPTHWLHRKWWLHGASQAIRRAHAQVFHGTNFEVPYRQLVPAVMTLHDLSPWKDPAWHHGAARVRRRAPWLLRWGLATMVITPTEAIRREAIAHFGLTSDRVVAIPLGPSRNLAPTAPAALPHPYFLFAGTIEPRKNAGLIVEAWHQVRHTHTVDLVLAGRRREDGPVFPTEPGLHLLGEVTDTRLAGLYSGAVALVYASHYEGFGLPVLEAMQCGAAVIVSHDPALLEVAGEAALVAATASELAHHMRNLLDQPALLADHRARSLHRAAAFDWTQTARLTHAVYEEALARFH